MSQIPWPDLLPFQWACAVLGAMSIGFSKSGFAGVGLIHILIFAYLFGEYKSTGILLPMLIIGDICAVYFFRQHAKWDYIRRLLPPTLIGIVAAWAVMEELDAKSLQTLFGGIILLLAVLQMARMWRPQWFNDVPHSRWFAWSLGLFAGCTTMLVNGAGPIVAVFICWPLVSPSRSSSAQEPGSFSSSTSLRSLSADELGLIVPETLVLDVCMIPGIVTGMLVGRALVHRISQKLFDTVLLTLAIAAAVRMIWLATR